MANLTRDVGVTVCVVTCTMYTEKVAGGNIIVAGDALSGHTGG